MSGGHSVGKIQKICLLWIMFFLAAVAISSRGNSADRPVPVPFHGQWQYQGDMTPVLKIQVETVSSKSSAGKQRLAELKKQKYGCHHVMNGLWRCSRQTELDVVSASSREKIEKQIMTRHFEFLESQGGVREDHDGDSFKSWTVDRPVATDIGDYLSYEWTWTSTLSKIILRESNDPQSPIIYINLSPQLELSQQYSARHTIDRNRFESHIIQVHFSKTFENKEK